MSEAIKHECGIALIRLRKPMQYYADKYGSPRYGMSKLYLLMEKQRNRGQDGAGVANIKVDIEPGYRYISRTRSIEKEPIKDVFEKIHAKFKKAKDSDPEKYYHDMEWLQKNCAFSGEVWLGHLRYGTHGKNSLENVHPMLRQNNWRSKNLVVAGNFNMTNVDELFKKLIDLGQHPKEKIDTITVMEKMGHFLDDEVQRIFEEYKDRYTNQEITEIIESELDLQRVLERSNKDFDGGYAMAGLTGYGGAFVARDPNGIRPAYYYVDDEVVVVASEKAAIKTAFNADYDSIQEVPPGNALIIDKHGDWAIKQFIQPRERKACSFERIYFSRGTDPEIYQERKQLGRQLVPQILEAVNYDLKNTVFSYIPNTAETAFYGMVDGLEDYLVEQRKRALVDKLPTQMTPEELISFRPRVEKLVLKDAKLRTFITGDEHRDEMVSNVYDTTYEVIKKGVDTLVVIDDSIVRGTTLEKSIIRMLDRLEPKKIIVVSSAPQIRYPDCYGIDMSKMKEFVAFRAMLALLEERNKEYLLDEVYDEAKAVIAEKRIENPVQRLFDQFTNEEISAKIAEIIKMDTVKADVEVIYQTVEGLHQACPNNLGDWYFTGNYPTPGGMRVVNKAYVNFMDGNLVRAY
ncbi:MAG TPA: amidophosphoribosyltransferase [Cytophagales bacterium]|nr:amidophosphoribosyltransferase [Cytophagales bacterium]HAA18451.1 amidophosphoribosyltransferase [Cytophagales bacterium]HAP61594.1 amidophosphoribosyltransferase [Cytophagales bacterium]